MSYKKLLNDMTWSFSRLHVWEKCPYAFYLKYIEKRDGESNYYASNGKCIHEVFESLLKGKITLNECTQVYADRYELICEETKQSIMDSTYEKCMDYLCTIDGINSEKYEIIGVELKVNFTIGESIGICLQKTSEILYPLFSCICSVIVGICSCLSCIILAFCESSQDH